MTAKKSGHEVKVFLMGEAVEIETLTHEKFNVAEQVAAFHAIDGEILACGTCLQSRSMGETALCSIRAMTDCVRHHTDESHFLGWHTSMRLSHITYYPLKTLTLVVSLASLSLLYSDGFRYTCFGKKACP